MQSIHIIAESLPEAWQQAVLKCWEVGDSFPTEHDHDGDPNSKDVVATIHVKHPFQEPRIHRAFPGGLDDLEKYRSEVLFGVHDYFMDDKTNAERWQYTYHERLFEYKVPTEGGRLVSSRNKTINQIDKCVDLLKRNGHTRRAQAVTWQAWNDLGIGDPTCLQRLWFRVQREDGKDKLNMVIHMRSNDAYKAAYMNMHAFTELQKLIADEVGVPVGEYMHIADSFHIYGSYFDEFQGFLNMTSKRDPEDLVYNTQDMLPFFVEGCDELLKESGLPEDKRILVIKRKEYLKNMISNSL
jgi:thymidylate synthase